MVVHLSTSFAVVPTVLLICASVLAHLSLRTQSQMQCRGMPTQVYSDVDDTLMCSNNKHRAGVDTQLPKGQLYPGAVAFQLALSRGFEDLPPLPVVLLSARPNLLRRFIGIAPTSPIARAFNALGIQTPATTSVHDENMAIDKEANSVPTTTNNLDLQAAEYGNLFDLLPKPSNLFNTVKRRRDRYIALGRTKLININRSASSFDGAPYPRCITFVGDSGQGDEIVARALVGLPGSYEDPVLSTTVLQRVHRVWIHHVLQVPDNDVITQGFTPAPNLDYDQRYVRFHSYPEAAYLAYRKGAISFDGLSSVVAAVEQEEVWVRCQKSWARNGVGGVAGVGGGVEGGVEEPCGPTHGDRCCVELAKGMEKASQLLVLLKSIQYVPRPVHRYLEYWLMVLRFGYVRHLQV